jgi:hypothetical protein
LFWIALFVCLLGMVGGGEKIKEIEAQTEVEISKSQSASAARQRVALELAQRLRYLRFINSKSNPQQGVILCHSFFECKFGVDRSWGVVNSLVINLAMVICFLLFLVCLFSSILSLSLATLLLNNNNNNTGSRIHKSSNRRQNEFCCRMTSCLRIVNSRERDRAS